MKAILLEKEEVEADLVGIANVMAKPTTIIMLNIMRKEKGKSPNVIIVKCLAIVKNR